MTIAELISVADELVDNVFSAGIKIMLVNEIEGRVQHDVLRLDPDEVEVYTTDDITAGTELLLGPPFLQVYVAWMKAMYYWHQDEYDDYKNQMQMFNNEWTRLCRTVSEAQCYGTSEPPAWKNGLPTRILPNRIVVNDVTYDADAEAYRSAMSFAELSAAIGKKCLPVCKVSGIAGVPTLFLGLISACQTAIAFALNQEWHNDDEEEFVKAALWISSSGTISWRFEES